MKIKTKNQNREGNNSTEDPSYEFQDDIDELNYKIDQNI